MEIKQINFKKNGFEKGGHFFGEKGWGVGVKRGGVGGLGVVGGRGGCAASNSAFIAQSPAKWCLGIFYTSVIANLVILLLTIF
ncbi:MAG: hypothetical protein IPQ11_10280 [Bacteroidetes bacterium]|nr:hypothetical protein [Bacteroidota bacterium]